jgi:hypothetical protein
MKYKSIIYFVVIFLSMTTLNSFSQPYETGLGFRLGGVSSGITVKHFTNSNSALEGILSFQMQKDYRGIMAAGLISVS